jgi:Skp family chaperone for outer membrane proteins
MIKKNNFFLAVIISLFLFNNVFAEQKVAFIDLNYIYANSKIGKKIIKEIKNKKNNLDKDFKEFQLKLDKEKENLLKQKNVLAKDEYNKKLTTLENNLIKYNEIISKKNKDLIDYQNKSKSEFKNALVSTLADFAKDNSISLILSKEQVLIGVKSLDVTKEILDLVNKS